MFKFLHAADLHLDSPLKGLEVDPDAPVEQIRGATRRALENLVELALDEEVAFVLLAGDLFDLDWKDYNTGIFFARCMGRLNEAGIPVLAVSGNHDAASVIGKALRPPPNVHFFPTDRPETRILEEYGVAVHGQGYRTRDVREDLAAGYPPAAAGLFNIGLLHTALTGRVGHEPYAPTTLDILRSKNYDYWALGHVHQREVVAEDPWIVFPGNLQGRHVRETGPRGAVLVTVEEGRVAAVENRDLDVLRWQECRVDLGGCASPEAFFDALRRQLERVRDAAAGRPLALRLVLTGATALHGWLHRHPGRLTGECRGQTVSFGDLWLEKVRLETRPEQDPALALEEDAPLAGLIQAVSELNLVEDPLGRVPELAELQAKLPPELTAGEDPFDLRSEQERRHLEEDVRELLLGRLLGQEDEG